MVVKERKTISDDMQQLNCVSLLVIHTWRKFANAKELETLIVQLGCNKANSINNNKNL